ncbi:MAG: acyl-protein synthetase [Polyangiaceae bacterium]|nr:acyl-protein synthetase [Polyangiaceae bacterium]
MTLMEQSEALHRRVRLFAELSLNIDSVTASGSESFEELARSIAQYQYEAIPGFQRLVDARNADIKDLAQIPALPVDLFRMTRIAAHPEEIDKTVFYTSGTTGSERGEHPVRDLQTYNELALRLGQAALFSHIDRAVVIALGEYPGKRPSSSLGHMMGLFMSRFDGRPILSDPAGALFRPDSEERWLANSQGIDINNLERAAKIAVHRSEPLVILATSFALVALLEALDGKRIATPSLTRIMITGGFKGRTKEVGAPELRASLARALNTEQDQMIGEYGMTELTSQLYEDQGGEPGVFFAPPWLRVDAVSPDSGEVLPPGQAGLARFIDLGNIDSALAILTQDQVRRREDGGIELLGRAPQAPVRGCSLPFEGLIS